MATDYERIKGHKMFSLGYFAAIIKPLVSILNNFKSG